MHELLKRQLKQIFSSPDEIPKEIQALLETVSESYQQADDDRVSLEHALKMAEEQMAVQKMEFLESTQRLSLPGDRLQRASQASVSYQYVKGEPAASETGQFPEQGEITTQPEADSENGQTTVAVPIKLREETLGALEVNFEDPAAAEKTADLVEQISARLALAIENARLYNETQISLGRTEALFQVSRSAIAIENLPDLLQTVANTIRDTLPSDRVLIFTMDLQGRTVNHFVESYAPVGEITESLFGELMDGLSGWAIREQKAVLSPKGGQDPRESSEAQLIRQKTDAGSVLVVPMTYRNVVLGTLTAINGFEKPDFTDSDVELLVAMGNQVATAMENTRLFEDQQRQLRELTTLFEGSRAFANAPLGLVDIAIITASHFVRLTGGEDCGLGLYSPEDNMIRFLANIDVKNGEIIVADNPSQWDYRLSDYPFSENVLSTQQAQVAHVSNPNAQTSGLAYLQELGIKTLLNIPLSVKGQAIGIIELDYYTAEQHFTAAQLTLFTTLANQAATTLDNARLFEQSQEERRRFQDLYDKAPDCYFSINPKSQILEINETGLHWLGYTREEVVNKITLPDILSPTTRHIFQESFPKLIEEGQLANIEADFQRKDGSTFPVLANSTAIYDEDGTFAGSRTTARDVTLLRQIEEEQRRMAQAVAHSADAVVITDGEGGIQFVNAAFEEITGYAAEEIIGHNNRILSSGSQSPDFYQQMWASILAGEIWRGELVNKRKDGSLYNASLTISPITNTLGDVTQFVALQKDITEEKEAEAERDRLLADLSNRAIQLQTGAEVSQAASSILELGELLAQTVELIRERFLLYYVGVFLIDDEGEWAVLRAGTGKAGRTQVERAHKLKIGGVSMISACIVDREAQIALDVGEEAVFFQNPYLPDTRSEMAIPLVSRRRVIGALTIQSTRPADFGQEDVTILQTMGDQLANAIENARLFEQSQQQLINLTTIQKTTEKLSSTMATDEVVSTLLPEIAQAVQGDVVSLFTIDGEDMVRAGSYPYTDTASPEINEKIPLARYPLTQKVIETRQASASTTEDPRLQPHAREAFQQSGISANMTIPLIGPEGVIGVVSISSKQPGRVFVEDEMTMAQTLANQASSSFQNAHLFEQVQEALTRTEILYQASAELNIAQNYAEILQTLQAYTIAGQGDCNISIFNRPWREDDKPDWATPVVRSHVPEGVELSPRYYLKDLPSVDFIQQNEPTLVEDTATDPRITSMLRKVYIEQLNVKSLIITPLVAGGQWIGYINAIYKDRMAFADDEVRQLRALTGQAAVAIQSIRSLQLAEQRADEAQQRSEELALVNQVVSSVAEAFDLREGLQIIADELGKNTPADQIDIALLNDDKNILTIVARYAAVPDDISPVGSTFDLESITQFQEIFSGTQPLVLAEEPNHPIASLFQEDLVARGVENSIFLPLLARNEYIGVIRFDIHEKEVTFTEEQMQLAQTIVLQASTAIQNANLYDQTQVALTETETLYRASAQLNAAENYLDIITVLRQDTILGHEANFAVSLTYFDSPWTTANLPRTINVLENWARKSHPNLLIRQYSLRSFQWLVDNSKSNAPLFCENIREDPALDDMSRRWALRQGFKSMIFVPLVSGGQWRGYLAGFYTQPTYFPGVELRRLMALAGQAAIAVQGLTQLEQIRARARREQILSEITARVHAATNPDTIMRTAIEEVGRALGRKAFIYLGLADESTNLDEPDEK